MIASARLLVVVVVTALCLYFIMSVSLLSNKDLSRLVPTNYNVLQ